MKSKSRSGGAAAADLQKHRTRIKQGAPIVGVELPLMHDVMLLCSRLIEISKEFSGIISVTDQPLHLFLTNSLILPTVELFKQDQLESLKHLL